MSSYFDEIARNRLKSVLLMLIFGAFFSFIVFIAVLLLGGDPASSLAIAVVLIGIYAVLVYFMGDRAILKFSGAVEADRRQYPDLYDIVEGLTTAAQVPMPKVYTINDPNPNAFATGRNKRLSAICVTTGLLSMMNKDELQGVIAHETSHISNNDIQFMMIAVVFAGAIGLIAAVTRNMLFWGWRGGKSEGEASAVILVIALVVGILAPIIALLVRLAISRRREYMADANGARLTRSPASLASALAKIKNYGESQKATPVKHANEVTAMLYFSNPFKASSLLNLLSTHPPIEERIKRLRAMY